MVSFWSFWDVACDAVKLKGCGIHQKHAGLVEFESQNLSFFFFGKNLCCSANQNSSNSRWSGGLPSSLIFRRPWMGQL